MNLFSKRVRSCITIHKVSGMLIGLSCFSANFRQQGHETAMASDTKKQLVDVADSELSQSIDLGGGTTFAFQESVKEVTLNQEGIIAVNVPKGSKNLIIDAKRIGSVSLTATLANGKPHKIKLRVKRSDGSIQQVLNEVQRISGVESRFNPADGTVMITGKTETHLERGRLESLKAQYPDVIIDKTEKRAQQLDNFCQAINELLVQYGISQMKAVNYGRFISLKGAASNPQQKELALRIARSIAPNIEDGIATEMKGGEIVAADVVFLEVGQQNNLELGLIGQPSNFNSAGSIGQVSFNGAGGNFGKNLTWQVGTVSSMLKLIQEKSFSKILSNPKLVTRSGAEASFKAGGVSYYETKDEKGSTLFPVPFGVELKLTPKIDEIDQIDLNIQAIVSEMIPTSSGVAAKSESQVTTALTIQEGQSVLLSGFKGTKKRKSVSRVPLLADIPLVGEIFKGRKMQDEATEILILLNLARQKTNSEKDKSIFNELLEKADDTVGVSFFD